MCLVAKKTKMLKQKEYCKKFNKDFKKGPYPKKKKKKTKKPQSHRTQDNLYSPMYTDFSLAYKREQTF